MWSPFVYGVRCSHTVHTTWRLDMSDTCMCKTCQTHACAYLPRPQFKHVGRIPDTTVGSAVIKLYLLLPANVQTWPHVLTSSTLSVTYTTLQASSMRIALQNVSCIFLVMVSTWKQWLGSGGESTGTRKLLWL